MVGFLAVGASGVLAVGVVLAPALLGFIQADILEVPARDAVNKRLFFPQILIINI